jgi:hypothetical protein
MHSKPLAIWFATGGGFPKIAATAGRGSLALARNSNIRPGGRPSSGNLVLARCAPPASHLVIGPARCKTQRYVGLVARRLC